jgi:hypothetical protein
MPRLLVQCGEIGEAGGTVGTGEAGDAGNAAAFETGAFSGATGRTWAQETANEARPAKAKILAAKRFIEVRQKLAGTGAYKSCKICRKTLE